MRCGPAPSPVVFHRAAVPPPGRTVVMKLAVAVSGAFLIRRGPGFRAEFHRRRRAGAVERRCGCAGSDRQRPDLRRHHRGHRAQSGRRRRSLGANDLRFPPSVSARNGRFLEFPADDLRAAFNRWVNDNAGAILALLFPSSLSESVTGRDAAQTYSQQFLLTTASTSRPVRRARCATVPGIAAGLLEFRADRDAGADRPRLAGPLPPRRDPLWRSGPRDRSSTRNVRYAAADRHAVRSPWAPITTRRWRSRRRCPCGSASTHATACSTRIGDTLDFGEFDLGGGVWSSVKGLDRVRIAGAGMLQGSKSLVPTGLDRRGDADARRRDQRSRRGLGPRLRRASAATLTSRTSLNGSSAHGPLGSPARRRPAGAVTRHRRRVVSDSGHTPMDVGYKLSRARGRNGAARCSSGPLRLLTGAGIMVARSIAAWLTPAARGRRLGADGAQMEFQLTGPRSACAGGPPGVSRSVGRRSAARRLAKRRRAAVTVRNTSTEAVALDCEAVRLGLGTATRRCGRWRQQPSPARSAR